jgi:hypothetical protein
LAVSIKSGLTSCVSSIFPSQILCSMCDTSLSGRIHFLQVPCSVLAEAVSAFLEYPWSLSSFQA